MTTTCDEAAVLLMQFRDDEAAAYDAFLRKYRDNEKRRDKEHRKTSAGLVRADPNWELEDLNNKRVLVVGENGPGDEILTLGCVQDLRACCNKVIWHCDPRLQPLLRDSFPDVRFISATEAPVDPDLVIHAWQLVGRFRPALESFAWTADGVFSPYLHGGQPEPGKAPKPQVGLAWYSKGGKPGKTCQLDRVPGWATFFRALGESAQFVSLQHGETSEDLQAVQDTIQVVKDQYGVAIYQDPSVDTFNDFRALASQVARLDYVVSISTTVAHFAGALGVQGSVLLPDDPILHWQAGQHTCVWYPTLRPVRHAQVGDWDSAIAEVTRSHVRCAV
jgi:hypothetical protein